LAQRQKARAFQSALLSLKALTLTHAQSLQSLQPDPLTDCISPIENNEQYTLLDCLKIGYHDDERESLSKWIGNGFTFLVGLLTDSLVTEKRSRDSIEFP
jgi:hypothetical protein